MIVFNAVTAYALDTEIPTGSRLANFKLMNFFAESMSNIRVLIVIDFFHNELQVIKRKDFPHLKSTGQANKKLLRSRE